MQSLIRWLQKDLYRVERGEHTIAAKRWHGISVLGIVIAVVLIFALGVFVGFHYPYRTLPRPPIPPGQKAPPANCPHTMGGCLPAPAHPKTAGDPPLQGPDLSNNNPASCGSIARIASANSFLIVKVIEGTGYFDSTAGPMVACARVHRLTVGGYDFLHVCLVSPTAEAHFFVVSLIRDRITGVNTLPPVGDAEYPSSPQCNARAWIAAWAATVYAALHRHPMIYTGAWWWQPHLGAFWLAASLAWISGYGVRYPYMPSGRTQLDMWQFSDHGFNGAFTSDMSVWRDGARAYAALVGRAAPAKTNPYAIYLLTIFRFGSDHASERRTVETWDHNRCKNPVRRVVCKTTRFHLILLRDRDRFVAYHQVVRGHWVSVRHPRWNSDNLGARYRGISRRVG